MCDTLDVVEITDTSINVEAPSETKTTPTTSTKRPLDDLDETPSADKEEHPQKKIRCSEGQPEEIAEDEPIPDSQNEADATLVETTEVLPDETFESKIDLCDSDIMDKTISDDKSLIEELIEDEPLMQTQADVSNEEEIEEEYTEEIGEDEIENEHSEEEHSEESDGELMTRAIMASARMRPKPVIQNTDEPIALDDSEDENEGSEAQIHNDSDRSSEYSVDNRVLTESEDEHSEDSDQHAKFRIQQLNPKCISSRKIVKKSLRMFWKQIPEKQKRLKNQKEKQQQLAAKSDSNLKISKPSFELSTTEKTTEPEIKKKSNVNEPSVSTKDNELQKKTEIIESMDLSSKQSKPEQIVEKLPAEKKISTELPITDNVTQMDVDEETPPENGATINETTEVPSVKSDKSVSQLEIVADIEKEKKSIIDSPPRTVSNELPPITSKESDDQMPEDNTLLTEISATSVEEIFNRYVFQNVDNQSPTLEEFSEELFYCLQQNKTEIQKAQQLWNEKIHVKYKIRELLERIRRHRAVMEIETFGCKPSTETNAVNNPIHPAMSSKSSTTTNSEHDLRMTNDSVSRLIYDVRASMLKRDGKQRNDGTATASSNASIIDSFTDNNSSINAASTSVNSSGLPQGRQGPIIDVQSIINDFRQKNPQEIPRRGRRMKNSFGSGGLYESQQQDDNNYKSNSNGDYNDLIKSSRHSGGYPEVSLLPVQNFYKNLNNSASSSASGSGLYGDQKSSLLQSILTKQSTKNSGNFQNVGTPTTSTLARLLTAPERSVQGSSRQVSLPTARNQVKVHNNGEITITPIAAANSRKHGYSMDDDDNSMEPPLVIDESEDFDLNERQNTKSMSDLLCQGCKKNRALFMCAGCSRQWYCSKECQEVAWDEHAENCMV